MSVLASSLERVAEARLAESAVPPQRYGLSVILRKAYPSFRLEGTERGTGNKRLFHSEEAEAKPAAWGDLPSTVADLLRRRAADDVFVAAHILRERHVRIRRVSESATLDVKGASTIFIDVQPGVELTLVEDGGARAQGAIDSSMILLSLGDGSSVRWLGTSVGASGFTVRERLAILAPDAVLEHHTIFLGPSAVRENIHAVLAGPGATARVRTLIAGMSDHQFDLGVTAEHRAPRTVSDLRAKAVLAEKSQAVVRGLIRVEHAARGSDGYQRCDALLLSPTAEVDPIPTLEINTDDVRCTHGVTVGHVHPEQMFYLQSRGLPEEASKAMLVEGFAGSMLSAYPKNTQETLAWYIKNMITDLRKSNAAN